MVASTLTEAAAAIEVLLKDVSSEVLIASFTFLWLLAFASIYALFYFAAPHPRPSTPSEKKFRAILADGSTSELTDLPDWCDSWAKSKNDENRAIEPAELYMSVVVPAYNEEERLPGMLEEAITFLEREYGSKASDGLANSNGVRRRRGEDANSEETGWEIIIVSDGSTDKTVETALDFARTHALSVNSPPAPGPRTPKPDHTTHISASRIRVVELEKNRGKGGAVIHGMRHVRGKYVIFADADGASKFEDLEKMVAKAKELEANDTAGRAVVVGSRAHLVGSEAVVKRSLLRNVLMYSFHVFIRLLTTAKTSRIGDTQCGFKLFTRPALPHVVPYMHSEGWIFDVEMLMLTEAADIPMEEVHVGWKEIPGSKLNVIWASLGMAWGLVIMRGAWVTGIWKRV